MRKIPWSYKLFDAASDASNIIKWSANGKAIIVDDQRYEREVMQRYPDLVAIPSFNNLRRQMRQYNFDYSLNPENNGLEFCHQYFIKGRSDLISQVTCRKKGELLKREHDGTSYQDEAGSSQKKKRYYKKKKWTRLIDVSPDSSLSEAEQVEGQEAGTPEEGPGEGTDEQTTSPAESPVQDKAYVWPLNPYAYLPAYYRPVTPPPGPDCTMPGSFGSPFVSWPGSPRFMSPPVGPSRCVLWPSPSTESTPPRWMTHPAGPFTFSPPPLYGLAGYPMVCPVSVPASPMGGYGPVQFMMYSNAMQSRQANTYEKEESPCHEDDVRDLFSMVHTAQPQITHGARASVAMPLDLSVSKAGR